MSGVSDRHSNQQRRTRIRACLQPALHSLRDAGSDDAALTKIVAAHFENSPFLEQATKAAAELVPLFLARRKDGDLSTDQLLNLIGLQLGGAKVDGPELQDACCAPSLGRMIEQLVRSLRELRGDWTAWSWPSCCGLLESTSTRQVRRFHLQPRPRGRCAPTSSKALRRHGFRCARLHPPRRPPTSVCAGAYCRQRRQRLSAIAEQVERPFCNRWFAAARPAPERCRAPWILLAPFGRCGDAFLPDTRS